jgi:PAS domain S-box-containing protein
MSATDPEKLAALIRERAAVFDIPGHSVIGTTVAGCIVYWNDEATRMYGWSANEALGQDITKVTPAEQTREEAVGIMSQLSQGRIWTGSFMVRRRDGREFLVNVRDVPVRDLPSGELIGIVGVSSAQTTD